MVTVNGQPREDVTGLSLTACLTQLGMDAARVAVELNGDVVPAAEHPQRVLVDGDSVEIVHFLGGG